jgi:hypothetical protein
LGEDGAKSVDVLVEPVDVDVPDMSPDGVLDASPAPF